MTRTLEHRGPDDEGFFVDGAVGLGHRRLSIVDPSPTGHQPMRSAGADCWIAYNGEFYNHRDFRPALERRGLSFRGTSDTETLLYLLQSEGPQRLEEVAGIFGLAFWDGAERRLILARDPLGVKQLYYYDDGSSILFASEIKALLQAREVPREPDIVGINEYLHFHTPLFDRTFLRHVRQVRAGEYLEVSARGIVGHTYWKLDEFGTMDDHPARRGEQLTELLDRVVRDQLMSDVPTGAFFSGGIDSSAVASIASRARRDLPCFGVHFTDQGVIDERPYQEAAARALGVEVQLTTMDGSSLPDDLMRLIYFQDQPVLGAAMLPMDRVSHLASQQVKVCLGGQGADEIFGGYARYSLTQPWRVATEILRRRVVGTRAGAGSSAGGLGNVGGNLWKQAVEPQNLRRMAGSLRYLGDWRARYFEHFAKVPEDRWSAVFASPDLMPRSACRDTFMETVGRSPARAAPDKAMHWDVQTYLTGLFHQDDRMSMMWSLESRVPLADPRLVRFAFRLGSDVKFRDGATKWILRQAVAPVLPEEVLNRRKVGFDTPAEAWMRDRHPGFLRDLLLSSRARERGLWNPKGIRALLDQPHQHLWFDVVWKVACIEAWASIFLDEDPPVGPPTPRRGA